MYYLMRNIDHRRWSVKEVLPIGGPIFKKKKKKFARVLNFSEMITMIEKQFCWANFFLRKKRLIIFLFAKKYWERQFEKQVDKKNIWTKIWRIAEKYLQKKKERETERQKDRKKISKLMTWLLLYAKRAFLILNFFTSIFCSEKINFSNLYYFSFSAKWCMFLF